MRGDSNATILPKNDSKSRVRRLHLAERAGETYFIVSGDEEERDDSGGGAGDGNHAAEPAARGRKASAKVTSSSPGDHVQPNGTGEPLSVAWQSDNEVNYTQHATSIPAFGSPLTTLRLLLVNFFSHISSALRRRSFVCLSHFRVCI